MDSIAIVPSTAPDATAVAAPVDVPAPAPAAAAAIDVVAERAASNLTEPIVEASTTIQQIAAVQDPAAVQAPAPAPAASVPAPAPAESAPAPAPVSTIVSPTVTVEQSASAINTTPATPAPMVAFGLQWCCCTSHRKEAEIAPCCAVHGRAAKTAATLTAFTPLKTQTQTKAVLSTPNKKPTSQKRAAAKNVTIAAAAVTAGVTYMLRSIARGQRIAAQKRQEAKRKHRRSSAVGITRKSLRKARSSRRELRPCALAALERMREACVALSPRSRLCKKRT
jgi:hypothetical protein